MWLKTGHISKEIHLIMERVAFVNKNEIRELRIIDKNTLYLNQFGTEKNTEKWETDVYNY